VALGEFSTGDQIGLDLRLQKRVLKTYSCFEDMEMLILTPRVYKSIFICDAISLLGSKRPHDWGFEVTLRLTTISTTPLDECSARRTDLCLTTYNTHKRETSMSPAGFQPTIQTSELPQTARSLGSAHESINAVILIEISELLQRN